MMSENIWFHPQPKDIQFTEPEHTHIHKLECEINTQTDWLLK